MPKETQLQFATVSSGSFKEIVHRTAPMKDSLLRLTFLSVFKAIAHFFCVTDISFFLQILNVWQQVILIQIRNYHPSDNMNKNY